MTDAAPPPPPADDKDWTWVLDAGCPECGFDAATMTVTDVGAMLRDNVVEWQQILAGDEARLRQRPDAEHWSALEYACHVRDVYRIYDERLVLMLTQDGPHYANWDQNVTAVDDRYDQGDPATVADELSRAGAALASRFDDVTGDQWQRTGYRSDGAAFTVDSFARYFMHDPIHHLDDVAKGFARLDD
ncbi:MAG: DinB family protein [Acidimicrobiia bacterium]|nr:DinB family protein [Acidimicrobiia bacterium]